MKLTLPNLILFVALILVPCASALCNQTCGHTILPFPFGFSSGCYVQLNCSIQGTILAADFPVLSVTSDTILIKLPQKCNRSIEVLLGLYTANYAPSSENAIILRNCSDQRARCIIPLTTIQTSFELSACNVMNNNVSCYWDGYNRHSIIKYENVVRSGCQSLLSAVSWNSFSNNSTPSLEFETAKLEWWLNGQCDCAVDAKCILVGAEIEGNPPAYRCQCPEGFAGDGFREGLGCRKVNFHGKKLIKEPLLIGLSAGVITLFLLIVCIKRWSCIPFGRNKESNQIVENFLLNHGSLNLKRYNYSEIKKMTKSFNDKLGQGGYGSVYKGLLPDGNLVAVKLLTETNSNGEEFINEVASISRTSHVNIVNLLGFCYGRNKRALVYEYMHNKSLDTFIYNNGSPNTDCQLDWKNLYKIAMGVARGLEYLHSGCNTRIVHFDIKPQNILLDENFCPKISDFGLAKLCKKKQSILSVIGTRGTIGYIAPEVFSRNFGGVSHKSDVYSYGMTVIEMTGAKNIFGIGSMQSSDNYFPDKIYELKILGKTKNVDDIVSEEEESTRKMLLVGFWCIQTIPSDRPSMSKVVEMLEGSLKSIQIPPKPILFTPKLSGQEFSSTVSLNLEINESIDG